MTYYNIKDDLEKYPEALYYVIWSGRGAGKTYSALRHVIMTGRKFVYLKRTIEDVNFISKSDGTGSDVSPFKPLNRDLGWKIEIRPVKGKKGFCECWDAEQEKVVGFVLAVTAIHKVKGFDLSECDVIIYDEFIPQISESRINQKEADILLELQATVTRDRVVRGLPEVQVWLLANATNAVSPITEGMLLTDDIVEMSQKGIEYRFLEDRFILLHNVPHSVSMNKESKMFSAMRDTPWARMAFDNEFSYNDFSKVGKSSLKGCICLCKILYGSRKFFLYQNEKGVYIMTSSGSQHYLDEYNLSEDGDRMRFFYDHIRELKEAISEKRAVFESYSTYNLILNYQKIFY